MQYDESFSIDVSAQAAGVVVFDAQQRVLLVRELQGSKAGYWHIPSGSVEAGETPDQAAVREAYEETGLQVTLQRFLGAFLARLKDGAFVHRFAWLAQCTDAAKLQPVWDQEIAEARFFSQTEFQSLYQQGKVRMHATKLIVEAGYRAVAAEVTSSE